MDWREALQRQMSPVLARLLHHGFVLPLCVACLGTNGSMACGWYEAMEATGLDCIFEASHIEAGALPRPLPMLVVDQRSAAVHGRLDPEDEEWHAHDTTETRGAQAAWAGDGVAGLPPVSPLGRGHVRRRARAS
jgi:hypothetical protein